LYNTPGLSLPPYIQNIANALMKQEGFEKARAIATAISRCRVWASGGGGVSPAVKAAAAKAIAQLDLARAKAKATPNKGEGNASKAGMPSFSLAYEYAQSLDLLLAIRHVRTPAGERFYKKPIGSLIVTDKLGQAKKVLAKDSTFTIGGKQHRLVGVTPDGEKVKLQNQESGKTITMDPDQLPGSKVSNYRAASDLKVGTKMRRERAAAMRNAGVKPTPKAPTEPTVQQPKSYQKGTGRNRDKIDTDLYSALESKGMFTDAEREYISLYGASGYKPLNKTLRSKSPDGMQAQASMDFTYQEFADGLLSAMEKRATTRDMVTFRGVGYKAADLNNVKLGDTIHDAGFMSTSLDAEVSSHSFGKVGKLLQITIPKGTPALRPSDWEAEILLGPGTNLKVVKVGQRYIEVVVVE
jgi:hypothetical protein